MSVSERLASILSDLQAPGEFAVGGKANELPILPGMSFDGMGLIPLPITELVAEKIKAIAEPAPFGKGFDTVVDPQVRKAWQIDGKSVSFSNLQWNESIQTLTDRIVEELGCDEGAKVEPILYKVLLYEQGGHFKAHKDTEKEENMFATLVIQLPSECEGGSLVFQHGNEKKEVLFGQDDDTNAYQSHYAAFYADVKHSLEEVTSGYRLALTYSLCWKSRGLSPPSITNALDETLSQLISTWSTQRDAYKGPIGIVLDHEYTESYFAGGLNNLKGRDGQLIKVILAQNKLLPSNHQLAVVLVDIRRHLTEGACGWNDWDEIESDETIEDAYDIEGSSQHCGFSLEDLDLIDMYTGEKVYDDLDWGEHCDQEVEDYTGNAGPTRDTVYKKHVIVIYPKVFKSGKFVKNKSRSQGKPESKRPRIVIEID